MRNWGCARTVVVLRQSLRRVLRMSITVRIALGFLLAALLSATAIGVIGFQRLTVLHAQADFYQALLQTTTTLNTGSDCLKAIDVQSTTMLADASAPHVDEEVLMQDKQDFQTLLQQYQKIILSYLTNDLLLQHTSQIAVLENGSDLAIQQHTYAAGAWRTWSIYQETELQILQDVAMHHPDPGQSLAHLQGEPEFADAFSALRSLIQFDEQLATLVDGATSSASLQFGSILSGALLVFLGIVLIGFLMSRPLIVRLTALHRVTRAIQQGQREARVPITGQDEITDVSRSVNTMLDALVTALQQATTAREQTDLAYLRQRQLNEMKDQFLLHVSHELRTPLTEVYGFLQLLQKHQDELTYAQQETFIALAVKGCEELITFCTNMLDASKQAGQMQPPRRQPIALAELVEDLLLQQNMQEGGEHPVFPRIPSTLSVQADPQYLRQVMRNLLSNAFKYTPEHQAIFVEIFTPQRTSDSERMEEEIGICVRDTGPGIPPEEQDLLFQPFVRLKRDLAGSVRGTGLGLSLCRQLVEAMGGRIWVESSGIPGEGSRFCWTLPLARVEDSEPRSTSRSSRLPDAAFQR